MTSRDVAQAVSCWLPTAAGRVRARVGSSGICGGQSGTGPGFLRLLPFSLLIPISLSVPCPLIIRGWYNGPYSGRRTKWTA
jgi:hypothetical protein